MQVPAIKNKRLLNVLITRPETKAAQLKTSLQHQHINNDHCVLFDYQPLASQQASVPLLTQNSIIIFVSAAAVEFTHATYPASHWLYKKIFAVGKATQNALIKIGIEDSIVPIHANSEGLLSLPALTEKIADQSITIVRGNGGRECLANTLLQRGAIVSYLESYQRVWRILAKDISKQWYDKQINCIVVTSNAILEKLVQLTITNHEHSQYLSFANYWQNQCLWVVVSKRIAEKAKQLGLCHVINSEGASDEALTNTLLMIQNKQALFD